MRNDQIDEAQMAADFASLPDPANGPMRRARALVDAHISEYGMVPHPDKIKEAIAVELGLAEIRGIDRMRDAAQSAWKPIETAPKDGTEIIGVFHRRYDEDGPATVYGPWTVAWDGRKWRSSWDGSEVISSESDFGTEYKGPDIDPTHWHPLPGVSIPSTDRKSP